MRTAIGAAIIDEEKILLVRKRQSWILPGGKPKPDESDIECLCREVSEELSGTQIDNIRYYGGFEGRTPHTGDILRVKVYFADIKGELYQSAAEIAAYGWINNPSRYKLSDITSKIVDSLTRDEYLRHPSD
ncbi:MAG: NUDIX domain-containing protein [Nanoarchaeota archaeon]|nr:NUDIX domain-containing protein [Nanoarchaeota archaeon]